jgi:hypothetical protein
MPDTKFDPFKLGVAETLKRIEENQHHQYAQSERIRERVFRREKHLVPKLNSLYDTLRTPNGWRYMADAAAKGTILTVASSTATVNVNLISVPYFRQEQWPNAIQVHLVVRFFGIAPQVVPATAAAMEVFFFDTSGVAVPLGEFMNTSGGNSVYDHIIPTPITDTLSSLSQPATTGPQVGILQVTDPVGGTTVATYNWSMSFSLAYLLPSIEAYSLREEYPQPVIGERNGHHA